jgi:hypothetical protein
MKTTKIYTALTLALVLFAVNTVSSATIGKSDGRVNPNPVVKHHVTVTLSGDPVICNTYLVEILDGKGNLVAPAKVFVPGVTGYDFYERGPASGARVAVLVLAPMHSHFQCETELFTAPAMVFGEFWPGQTYRYDLFPQSKPPKE